MNRLYRYMFLAFVAMVSFTGFAAESLPHDTVYFYNSWEDMYYLTPQAMVVDPYIEEFSPFEIHIYLSNGDYSENIDDKLLQNHIAVSIGDSIMLMNSSYLRKNFKGDANKLSGCVPVFFNEKAAYVLFTGSMGMKQILFGMSEEDQYIMDYYYIDFINRKVLKVTPSVLSALLEDYHDLQMRYEGMRDYKKREIIEDYFLKYIDRVTNDFMKPSIFDLVE